MPEISGWTIRWHALQRALDMAVEGEEIRLCLTEPKLISDSPERYPKECKIYERGRIAIAVNEETREAITVLWNTGGYWRFDRDDDELWWRD
ncbi:hypothetical protein [Streptomyces solincola]|nr:hypothetical protein [Streptomyces solincola]